MGSKSVPTSYRERLELALIHHLGARGESLHTRIASVADELPPDLHALLQDLETDPADGNVGASLDYVFRCGRAVERIESVARARAEDLLHTGMDGRPPVDPAPIDLDALARFRITRDRWLRKAADWSLKFIATTIALLVLGLLLGLI